MPKEKEKTSYRDTSLSVLVTPQSQHRLTRVPREFGVLRHSQEVGLNSSVSTNRDPGQRVRPGFRATSTSPVKGLVKARPVLAECSQTWWTQQLLVAWRVVNRD